MFEKVLNAPLDVASVGSLKLLQGIINLVPTQNFPKNLHFLPPDTHVSGDTYQGIRNVSFWENFAQESFLTKDLRLIWKVRVDWIMPTYTECQKSH